MKTLSQFLSEATTIKLKGTGAERDKAKHTAFVNWIHNQALFTIGNRATFAAKHPDAKDGFLQAYLIASAYPDHVYLHELTVLGDGSDHKKGMGSAVMAALTKEADKRGIVLRGAVQPLKVPGGKKIPVSKLRAFYKKFGFEQYGGQKDSIIRYPKK